MIKKVDNMLSINFHYLVGLLICPFEFLFKYVRLSKKEVMSNFGLIAQLVFFVSKIIFKNLIPDLYLQHIVTFVFRFCWLSLIRIRAGWLQICVFLIGFQTSSLGLPSQNMAASSGLTEVPQLLFSQSQF